MVKVLQVSSTTWYCFLAAKTDLWIVELWVRLSFLWFCYFSWFSNCLFDCLLVKQSFLAAWSSTSDDKALRSLGRGERWQFKISNQSMLKLVKQRWNFIKQRMLFFNTFLRIATLCHGQVVPSIWHETEKHIWKLWTDGETTQQQNSWNAGFMKGNCAFGRWR